MGTRKTWGALLRVIRIMSAFTQDEMARRLNVDQATVSRAESGKVVSVDLIRDWINECGGISFLDAWIRKLKSVRELLDCIGMPDVLMQA